jgi:hypothetical protein
MDRDNRNPLMMLAAGFGVGLLIGLLIPISRFERERLGPVADDLKHRAKDAIKESIATAASPEHATS